MHRDNTHGTAINVQIGFHPKCTQSIGDQAHITKRAIGKQAQTRWRSQWMECLMHEATVLPDLQCISVVG